MGQGRIYYYKTLLFMALLVAINLIGCSSSVKISHRLQWWLSAINWDETRLNYSGKNVTIAIIDTGIDMKHPDLANVNFIEEVKICSQSSEKTDDKSHGTAIAGIIAAFPSSSKGALGVATDVNIVSIDVTDGDCVELADLIEGIRVAAESNVDIISISVGLKEDNSQLHDVIIDAYNKGIIIIASAGNYMENDLLYPAKYDEVICVGSTNKEGEIISPKGSFEKTIVYLPGENIVTTSCDDDGYVGANGTSFSTAIFAGVIAILKEAGNDFTVADIYEYIDLLEQTQNFDTIQFIKHVEGAKK